MPVCNAGDGVALWLSRTLKPVPELSLRVLKERIPNLGPVEPPEVVCMFLPEGPELSLDAHIRCYILYCLPDR